MKYSFNNRASADNGPSPMIIAPRRMLLVPIRTFFPTNGIIGFGSKSGFHSNCNLGKEAPRVGEI